ncbi:putative transcription factor C2H2 family [Helianthus annuus]|uniref:Transcription factor C2H2 family n=1 Tax=Helianthus annuus TaxID=4232 RepID=A0A9K3EEA3_HELAN|nr:putative transcription factor C2H2 family [Helianthus annuus]
MILKKTKKIAAPACSTLQDEGRDRDEFERDPILFCTGVNAGFMVTWLQNKIWISLISTLKVGIITSLRNTKLKFDMVSYQEKAVSQLRQMSEDNQQLHWYKNRVVKEQMHVKALEESLEYKNTSSLTCISSPPTNMRKSVNQEVFTGCNVRLGRKVWKWIFKVAKQSLLKKHKQGKKHLKRMKRLADSSANPPNMLPPPVASEIVVGEMKNKKQRLLQNGATAETLLSCDVCNVICNNQEGFQQHIASKKHAAKVTSIIFYLDYCLYIIYFFLLKVFHYN